MKKNLFSGGGVPPDRPGSEVDLLSLPSSGRKPIFWQFIIFKKVAQNTDESVVKAKILL